VTSPTTRRAPDVVPVTDASDRESHPPMSPAASTAPTAAPASGIEPTHPSPTASVRSRMRRSSEPPVAGPTPPARPHVEDGIGHGPCVELLGAMPSRLRARVLTLDGRRVVFVDDRPAPDAAESHPGGPLGAPDGEVLAAAARHALDQRLPLLVVLATRGTAVEDGLGALDAWGRSARMLTACSGVVPILVAVTGPAVSGPSLLLGLADLVVMSEGAHTYVNSAHAVRDWTGEVITSDELAGAGTHALRTGVAALVAADHDGAVDCLRDLLAYLPDSNDALAPCVDTNDPIDRRTPEAGALIPATATGSYDVCDVIRAVVDDGDLLEVRAGWAPNLVTAFATVAGRPVGVVASQPCRLAGTLDIAASQKGARFVSMCDALNLPLVTFVDTPGFSPGKDLEWRGMIRHGAQLAFAYTRATVPRVCITLRKSYGGAYIVMDSKTIGNDLSLAWPSAEIAVMGAKGAVEILHRAASPAERHELEQAYEERLLNPYAAAERGYVDAVIDPADTRIELAAALEVLQTKREHLPPRKHDNTPL